MILHAVWTLKRGVIDPPERIEPDIEGDICAAIDHAARIERDAPMSNEEMWKLQGYADGYIKRKLARREAA